MSRQYFPVPVCVGEEESDNDRWSVLICDYDDEREGFSLTKDIQPEIVFTGTFDECSSFLEEKIEGWLFGRMLIEADAWLYDY